MILQVYNTDEEQVDKLFQQHLIVLVNRDCKFNIGASPVFYKRLETKFTSQHDNSGWWG